MTASLELSRELYELSGWEYAGMRTHYDNEPEGLCPAYSCGYLLRRLPPTILQKLPQGAKYIARLDTWGQRQSEYADTPEDALTALAIELFKNGILTKEQIDE